MNNLSLYISILFLVFGLVFLTQALPMDYYSAYGPGPGMIPLWINGLLIVLSIFNIGYSLKADAIRFADVFHGKKEVLNVLTCLGALVLFLAIVSYTGFTVAGIIMLLILFARGYKWYWNLGLSVGITLAVFWVFNNAFQIALPVNVFGW